MKELEIPNATGIGGLTFFERLPVDTSEVIDSFSVRLTEANLSAAANVYAGHTESHPAALFAAMAKQWSGWAGELVWESLERELSMRCTHDRFGHISILVEIHSGPMPEDWRVRAIIMTEAGQLETIARRAALFFGKPG